MPVWVQGFVFGLGAMVVLASVGVPIGFAMGIVGFSGLLVFAGAQTAFDFMSLIALSESQKYALSAIPLFVMMAQLLVVTKVGAVAYDSTAKLLSGLPGSLAIATNAAGTMLGAVMGSSAAACATLSHIGIGEMKRYGYSNTMTAGAVAGAGGLAIIIPPSLLAIVYSFVMDVSVIKMFAAGILPGLLMGIGYMVWVWYRAKTRPNEAPLLPALPMRERLRGGVNVVPILLLIAIVLGSIYSGLASVTESAAFGAIGAFLVGLFYHLRAKGSWGVFGDGLRDIASTTGFIMVIVLGAFYFGQFWTFTGVTQMFSQYLVSLQVSPLLLLIAMNLALLLLGCLMDGVALVIVMLPLFVKALMPMGMDPIWLGMIFLINLEAGVLTPPVGVNLFVVKGVGEKLGITFEQVCRGSFPYVVIDCVVIALVIVFPELALWPARVLG